MEVKRFSSAAGQPFSSFQISQLHLLTKDKQAGSIFNWAMNT